MQASFALLHDEGSPATPTKVKRRTPHGELHYQKSMCSDVFTPSTAIAPIAGVVFTFDGISDMSPTVEEANRTFSTLLRSEIFDTMVPQAMPTALSPDPTLPSSPHSTRLRDTNFMRTSPNERQSSSSVPAPALSPSTPHKNLFSYMSPRHHHVSGHLTPSQTPHMRRGPNLNARSEIYSLSPVRPDSQRLLLSPRKPPRAVSKVPFKVLDAPDLAEDFYLNLVDWGSTNILGVGLGSCVFMWNSQSGQVTKLCDLEDDIVTSVNWIQRVFYTTAY